MLILFCFVVKFIHTLTLLQSVAKRVAADKVYGDIYAQYAAFDAMFSTIYGDSSFVREKTSTFTDLFSSICSSKYDTESGCSLFSVNFYAGRDRTLSVYEYQVSCFNPSPFIDFV